LAKAAIRWCWNFAVYTLNGLFALISYVAATVLLIWGTVLVQVFPSHNRYEAAGIFGAIFGFSVILLALAWRLKRRQRVEMSVSAPRSWRLADYVLCVEAAIAGLFLIEALLTALP
jgi:hypothetical protein